MGNSGSHGTLTLGMDESLPASAFPESDTWLYLTPPPIPRKSFIIALGFIDGLFFLIRNDLHHTLRQMNHQALFISVSSFDMNNVMLRISSSCLKFRELTVYFC